jgi:hypothetical protein
MAYFPINHYNHIHNHLFINYSTSTMATALQGSPRTQNPEEEEEEEQVDKSEYWTFVDKINRLCKEGRLKQAMGQLHAILIQVDISGHPPFSTGSKQFSGNFGNLLFLAGFNFRGHFEGLNKGFLRSRFSMIAKGMIEPPK